MRFNWKKISIIILGIITFLVLLILWKIGYFRAGNSSAYSVSNTQPLNNSPLKGKVFYFLGSSVTDGMAAYNESFVDYISQRNQCIVVKNAVSLTKLRHDSNRSYIKRILKFDTNKKIDAFICQLSTNDAQDAEFEDNLGEISQHTNYNELDVKTTTGAIEYIISYARNHWDCPVIFYTNSYFESMEYKKLIARLYQLQKKWDFFIIDLYNSPEMNAISQDKKDFYMLSDYIHPLRAGYKLWWTPYIEKELVYILSQDRN